MHYSHYLAAAAVLAAAASASPAGIAVAGDLKVGPLEIGGAFEADVSLCHGAHAAAGAVVKVGCDFHTPDFSARMNTPAHRRYEEALEIYHDVMHLIRHSLMTRGHLRMKRLVQIAMLVHDGEAILKVAAVLNRNDARKVRRSWIAHEIHHLLHKFERAAFYSRHLPNLCLAQDIFHFVVDASVAVVEFALSIPIAIGAAIGVAIYEAAHLVARAFHYMAHVLNWAIHEIEYAFIMFIKKTKRFLKKVGAGIKAGFKAIGHGLHRIGHDIKEGAEDVVSIIVDIGHHLHHHHHCHAVCNDDSSSSSDSGDSGDCGCGADSSDDGYATVTQVCQAEAQVCTKEAFTAKVTAHYDIELSWTKEESHTKVMECATQVFGAFDGLRSELRAMETEVTPQLEAAE
jgi:hypothetical protein